MGMTRQERATRRVLENYLRAQGYVTYASLLSKFDLNFYKPAPGDFFAAAMVPGKYVIYINPIVKDKEALSTFIRHEILHEYLKHYDRVLRHIATRAGLNYDELDELSLKGIETEFNATQKMQNIAGDYEISNRGYTERDKDIMRNLGKFLEMSEDVKGLVTEDDHPEWVNLPIEDMYDLIRKEADNLPEPPEPPEEPEPIGPEGDPIGPAPISHYGTFVDDHTFVDENGNPYDLANPS